MNNKFEIEKKRVFEIFGELTKIPRGSGNMKSIADYCEAFAKSNGLKYIRDRADNLIIFKNATKGFESSSAVILQGHLDMVCQKTADSMHDFGISGPVIKTDGDFLRAKDTSLGADNGIAIAIIMTILESKELNHPAIEAVFTTDEEIGLIGATELDTSPLTGKYFINLDSEDEDTVTVSCAGGSEFQISLPIAREDYSGIPVKIRLFGLQGGHSGVEIDKGRVNSNILAGRLLNHLYSITDFRIANINGGDKSNAITLETHIELSAQNSELLIGECEKYLGEIKSEISAREPDFDFCIDAVKNCDIPFSKALTENLIFLLVTAPNGIINMSAEIKGLVETSLNLGILKTEAENVIADFSLRSNKNSAHRFLEEKLEALASRVGGKTQVFGHYPPWEYKQNNPLLEIYCKSFTEFYGFEPKVEAIHAGLECGVFSSKIKDLCCIAVGPQMYDVHTVKERLSISSTEKFTQLLLTVLEKL